MNESILYLVFYSHILKSATSNFLAAIQDSKPYSTRWEKERSKRTVQVPATNFESHHVGYPTCVLKPILWWFHRSYGGFQFASRLTKAAKWTGAQNLASQSGGRVCQSVDSRGRGMQSESGWWWVQLPWGLSSNTWVLCELDNIFCNMLQPMADETLGADFSGTPLHMFSITLHSVK